MMIAGMLIALALLDAAFAGFRDAAGRNPLLHKGRYTMLAMIKGALVGVVAIAIIAATVGAMLALAEDFDALWADCLAAGARMVKVYSVYGTIAIGAPFVYAIPRPEISSLVTVLILGPFTLLRPFVIIAGALWAIAAAPRAEVVVFALVAGTLMAALEKIIGLIGISPRDLDAQIALR